MIQVLTFFAAALVESEAELGVDLFVEFGKVCESFPSSNTEHLNFVDNSSMSSGVLVAAFHFSRFICGLQT